MSAIDPQNDTDPEMDHDGAETSGNFSGGGKSEFSARNDDTGDRVAGERSGRQTQETPFSTALAQSERQNADDAPLLFLPTAHGEHIRRLRTELMLRHGYQNADSLALAVVSPTAGDGRSLLALELATSFAQLGRRTLLIDADMRTPIARRIFGHQLHRGLAQTLATGDTPKVSIVKGYPTLSIFGAGDESGFNPTELLAKKRFQRLIDSTRKLFDFIVVDTPPFNAYSDSQVISAVVGRVITLHRAPINTYKDTREMLGGLSRSGAEILGAVLNKKT